MAQEPTPESTPLPEKMRAVIFKGPFEVAVEDRPVPKIQNPTDVVLRVTRTALCGSDLHYYRGHMKLPYGFICGHEFVGIVEETGSEISKFKKHDEVVVPFTTSCGTCFYCSLGETSRCEKLFSFGFSHNASCIEGGQAEFVRVPYADSSMVLLPTSIPKDLLVLMADVFPTGYFAAQRFLSGLRPDQGKQITTVVVGCGPVGCCAIASALYLTRGGKVFAVDGVEERLQEAAKLGAIPLNLNDGVENLVARVQSETSGRGADVALELVGSNDALDVSLQVIRPFGKVSSIGVHTADITIPAAKFYGKNATIAMGRCPVSGVFKESLVALEAVHSSLNFLVGQTMTLEQAPEAYRLFEQRKVHKIVFDLESPSAS